MPSNHYFVCLPDRDEPAAFDPFRYDQNDFPGFIEIHYLAGALQVVEQEQRLANLTFYVTWSRRELPTYGDNVVVVLMGDEWCHRPNYLQDVKMVFRQYGTHPEVVAKAVQRPSRLGLMLLLQFFRAALHGLLGRLRRLPHDLVHRYVTGKQPTRQYVIPLGYANQLELPLVAITARPTDIYFAGSLNNLKPSVFSLKYWLQSPKNIARHRAIGSAKKLQAKRPELDIRLETTPEHVPSKLKGTPDYQNEALRYSHQLMNAKICLVPRGSSLDTPRFFEALRYGCVAVADRLPAKWFYDGAPVIQVDDWNDLERIVDGLLSDPERLEQLHREALTFWHTRCSEEVLGRFMAEQLASSKDVVTNEAQAAWSRSKPKNAERR